MWSAWSSLSLSASLSAALPRLKPHASSPWLPKAGIPYLSSVIRHHLQISDRHFIPLPHRPLWGSDLRHSGFCGRAFHGRWRRRWCHLRRVLCSGPYCCGHFSLLGGCCIRPTGQEWSNIWQLGEVLGGGQMWLYWRWEWRRQHCDFPVPKWHDSRHCHHDQWVIT